MMISNRYWAGCGMDDIRGFNMVGMHNSLCIGAHFFVQTFRA